MTLSRLQFVALSPAASSAVLLQRTGGGVTVAADRLGAGRVVQIGYEDTWRWRMMGGDESPAAHRGWWGSIVSAAAYAPVAATTKQASPVIGDAAPLAGLVAALGPPVAHRPSYAAIIARQSPARDALLFALAMLAFLAEWASRRLRGAA